MTLVTTTNMKQLTELIILTSLLIITKSASDVEFEEDFIHSFLIKSEKLSKSERLKTADSNWLKSAAYKVKLLLCGELKIMKSYLTSNLSKGSI